MRGDKETNRHAPTTQGTGRLLRTSKELGPK